MLREIGDWLKLNGEAVYNSRPFRIFGEGPTVTATGHVSEKKNKPFGPKDIRFTTRGDTLYAFALAVPKSGLVEIKSLKNGNNLRPQIRQVELLGSESRLDWNVDQSGLKIRLPDELPSQYALVFRIR